MAEETFGPQKPSALPMSTRPVRGAGHTYQDEIAATGFDDVQEQVTSTGGAPGPVESSRVPAGLLGVHREERAVLQRDQPVERGRTAAAHAGEEVPVGRGEFHVVFGLEVIDASRGHAGAETESVPLLPEGVASVGHVGDVCQLASQPRNAGVHASSSLVSARTLPQRAAAAAWHVVVPQRMSLGCHSTPGPHNLCRTTRVEPRVGTKNSRP